MKLCVFPEDVRGRARHARPLHLLVSPFDGSGHYVLHMVCARTYMTGQVITFALAAHSPSPTHHPEALPLIPAWGLTFTEHCCAASM